MDTVAIAGVGLIGGSFGLALRAAGFTGRILGVSSPPTIQKAIERGAIDEGADLPSAASQADLIFLSQPILTIIETLRTIDAHVRPGALITDAGSTKGRIAEAARAHIRRGIFLGGHPMAGKERSGIAEAEAGLFGNRTWALCPLEPGDANTPAAAELAGWIAKFGAKTVFIEAEEHDRMVALTSHLPQLLSTALASTVANHDNAPLLAGPAIRDLTRLAMSPYPIWRDILVTNRNHIEVALKSFISELQTIGDRLESPDLDRTFSIARTVAEHIRSRTA